MWSGLDVSDLLQLAAQLAQTSRGSDDAERIDRIKALERIKAAAAAAQAREITEFAESQLAAQVAVGVPVRRQGVGIAEQIGLACRVSPVTAARQLTFAKALTRQLPHTFQLLASGRISEWVATLVVRETAALSDDDRHRVDSELVAELPQLSPRQAETATRRTAARVDPGAALRRARTARTDRRVTIRPAPDTMALLTGYTPVEQGVAAWANLDRHARALKAAGDPRSLAQIRSDTFIERLTGQATATAVPVEISLTMTADTLLAGGDEPAHVPRHGPLPAALARALAASSAEPDQPVERPRATVRAFVRRVFTDPIDHTVANIDTGRRRFDGALARLIDSRDQHCRMPFCTAPIRHHDHIEPHRDGGPTSAANAQGLCERASYVKEMPGWHFRTEPGRGHRITITTPTGHIYTSHPPPALGPGSRGSAARRENHKQPNDRGVDAKATGPPPR